MQSNEATPLANWLAARQDDWNGSINIRDTLNGWKRQILKALNEKNSLSSELQEDLRWPYPGRGASRYSDEVIESWVTLAESLVHLLIFELTNEKLYIQEFSFEVKTGEIPIKAKISFLAPEILALVKFS